MELNDKVIREVSAIVVVVLFGILVFFAVKPLLFAILWGLIGAYVFMPIFQDGRFRNSVPLTLPSNTVSLLITSPSGYAR